MTSPAPFPIGPSRWQRAKAWCVQSLLTFVLKALEAATVLAVFFVVCYAGWWLIFGDMSDSRYHRMAALILLLGSSWKAFLLLLIPLFYRTVRTFLEEVQEAYGMKRVTRPISKQEAPNPQPPAL